jgi:hypothetical protein
MHHIVWDDVNLKTYKYEVLPHYNLRTERFYSKSPEGFIFPAYKVADFNVLAAAEPVPQHCQNENCQDWVTRVVEKAKSAGIITARGPGRG